MPDVLAKGHEMTKALELANRVIPQAGSEWPLSDMGRAIAVGHANNILAEHLARIDDLEEKLLVCMAALKEIGHEVAACDERYVPVGYIETLCRQALDHCAEQTRTSIVESSPSCAT